MFNRIVPGLLDAKSIYASYVFGTLQKSHPDLADFYEELYDEINGRSTGSPPGRRFKP